VLVCFDATVLCGALRRPTGPNFRLLELAAEGVVVEGFTTEVVGMEFVRNALEGLGGVQYEIAVVEEFLDAFGALFDPDRVATSPVGRSLTNQTWLHNRPIGEVVYHLTGKTRADLLADLPTTTARRQRRLRRLRRASCRCRCRARRRCHLPR
jgi:hypothetical protein